MTEARLDAVLFDRDGTLIVDVPYNGDPALVSPTPGAEAAIARVRAAGLPMGVVTNQSGIGRGLITRAQAEAVNAAVDARFGAFAVWRLCPHAPDDGCRCRKPAPGMVLDAAAALGVDPARVAVIGDSETDVAAARAAGARGILLRPDTSGAAQPDVAADLPSAVELLLGP